MPTPVLIDTDMGIDDAIAVALALASDQIELVGMTSVGGNVPLEQATGNIGRVLSALEAREWPVIGQGLDQRNGLSDARHVFGEDGLGETDLPIPAGYQPRDYVEVFEHCLHAHGSSLTIIALGPLTNLAALMRERPRLLQQAGRIIVMGGALWCPGNVNRWAEFNFYRDAKAAAAVMSAGLPITLVSLDVTRQVALDESHVARLSRSGRPGGEGLARMLRWPLEHHADMAGKFLVHDAVAVGALLWPELFLRSRIGLEVVTTGEQVGRSKPVVTKDKSRQVGVVLSVNVEDFLENLLERICQEEFIV
ncbi:MAG TPA: nucleoside hydrolase [Phycisphaerae bacterium]|jgi:inosine-uridine nucleoside N-ribohydrolase|nr:nucleoside hydrolase [Phycisphaerae bacterium]HOB75578.1 nucleoside hydrolase [Phycisphaerae bacterium]HOJ55152.1 nucleoside hydrolase [Phycisphaerae bacterium]HOL27354.1 nucleoside hydrolase [Phycisphaerae bacterium]HPP20706.1 nucleoside hydrolase [Phycisphaerae bacterium]